MQKTIARMTGYKATNTDMHCNGYRFRLGEWSEPVAGNLVSCNNGYHFCEHLSGVWAYYPLPSSGTRVFKVEAEDVLVTDPEPGADVKRVCRRLRLVEEVTGFDICGNLGEGNSVCGNSGSRNTGDGNTGDGNAGNWNTGYRNTGSRNAGSRNTGSRNTGFYNTGDYNTGHLNTGNWNTGNRNTGSGNACSNSSGFFCVKTPTVLCFDTDSGLSLEEFKTRFGNCVYKLGFAIIEPYPPNFENYKELPGITPEKLTALWLAHRQIRHPDTAEA